MDHGITERLPGMWSAGRTVLRGATGVDHPILALVLKAELGLLVVAVPLFALAARTPGDRTLGIVEYMATWTIIWMVIVVVVAAVGSGLLYLARGKDVLVSRLRTRFGQVDIGVSNPGG